MGGRVSSSSGSDRFFPPQSALRQEGLHRRFSKTPASVVEIDLQLFDRAIKLFPERNAVELVQQRVAI
jgi:hypothetical protein